MPGCGIEYLTSILSEIQEIQKINISEIIKKVFCTQQLGNSDHIDIDKEMCT